MPVRHKNIFDKLGSLIPGFNGYSERSDKRKFEKELRNQIVILLERSEKNIITFQKDLIERNELIRMKDWEAIRINMNTIASRIRYANYGESSFFSSNQIKEAELIQILSLDELISDKAKLLFDFIENDLYNESTITLTATLLDEMNKILFDRSAYISNHK